MLARRILKRSVTAEELRNRLERPLQQILKQLSRHLDERYPVVEGKPVTIARLKVGPSTYLLAKLPPSSTGKLTDLQAHILRRVTEGLPNKAIAGELKCSEHTIASHLKRLHKKLNVHSRVALIWKSLALT